MEGDEGGERRDVDDAAGAAGDHVAAKDLTGAKGTFDVDVEDRVPSLVGPVEGGDAFGDASAVEEDVDGGKFGLDAFVESFKAFARRDVGGDGEGAASEALDLSCRGGSAFR